MRQRELISFRQHVTDEKMFTIRVVSVNKQQEAGL